MSSANTVAQKPGGSVMPPLSPLHADADVVPAEAGGCAADVWAQTARLNTALTTVITAINADSRLTESLNMIKSSIYLVCFGQCT
jgi:hypothetical protein